MSSMGGGNSNKPEERKKKRIPKRFQRGIKFMARGAVRTVPAGKKIKIDGKFKTLDHDVYLIADGRFLKPTTVEIGAGGYSKVQSWVDLKTGIDFAAKVFSAVDRESRLDIKNEADCFRDYYNSKYVHGGKFANQSVLITPGHGKSKFVLIQPKFLATPANMLGSGKHETKVITDQRIPVTSSPAKPEYHRIPIRPRGDSNASVIEDENVPEDLPPQEIDRLLGMGPSVAVEEKTAMEAAVRFYELQSRLAKGEMQSVGFNFSGDTIQPEQSKFATEFSTMPIADLENEISDRISNYVTPADVLEFIAKNESEASNDNISVTDQSVPKVGLEVIEDFDVRFERLLVIFENMCRCVQAAHELGIILTDVKLENFLVDDENNVYLIDFGGALRLKNGESSVLSKELHLRGTITYATPLNIESQINNRVFYTQAVEARQMLALLDVINKREKKGLKVEIPAKLRDPQYIEKLKQAAVILPYIYSPKTDAYSLACSGEYLCTKLIPEMAELFDFKPGKGLPDVIESNNDDPQYAKMNRFLKVTKGLRDQALDRITAGHAADEISALRKQIASSKPPVIENKIPEVAIEVDAVKNSLLVSDPSIIENKPNEVSPTRPMAPTIKFEESPAEYIIPEDPNKPLNKVIPSSDTKKRARSSMIGNFPHLPGLLQPKKVNKGLDPAVIRDIRECFKALDKSSVHKKEFIAAGTKPEAGASGIPYDCYRLPNGVIIAKTTTTLGAGANGVVYQGIDIKSGDLYAIKIPKINDDDTDNKSNDENKDQNIDKKERIEWSNKKIKLGNKLMASADIERNPQHDGMYHTMNLDGIEIAFMPKLDGEQLAVLIKTHVSPLIAEKLAQSNQKMPPAIKQPERRPSLASFIINEENVENSTFDAISIKAKVEPLHSIAYFREKRRNESDRVVKGYISRIINYLGPEGTEFLSIEKDENKKEKVAMIEAKVKSYLPDALINKTIASYSNIREEKVIIDDPEIFLKKLLQIVKDSKDACKDNANLLRIGATNRDIKPENMIRTQLGLTTIDYDEAEEFKVASDVIFGKEHVAKGSPYYLSPYNKEVYSHLLSNATAINAASEALGIYELFSQQGKLTEDLTGPGGLFSSENLVLLKILADPPDYVWNAQSEANAIGISAEELSQTCFKKLLLKKLEGGMPNKLISDTDDPCVAGFNKFLEITKKLINPDVNNTYVASQAAEDFEILEQRIEALQDVREQLKHPQPTQSSSITGRISSNLQQYLPIGATVKTPTDMTRQSPAWDNVIQTLAVELDPRKLKVEVKPDKSVAIKSKENKKTVGNLSLTEGNVYGTTSDADAFEQMLKVYIASHKSGETVQIQIVGLADDPEQALVFQGIANKLKVTAVFDAATKDAVDRLPKKALPSKLESSF